LIVTLGTVARLVWGTRGLTLISTAMLLACIALLRYLQRQRTRWGPRISHAPRITRRKPGDALPKPRRVYSTRPVEQAQPAAVIDGCVGARAEPTETP
jgi:hypothetical protein